MSGTDCYAILGVPFGASPEQIERAYKLLVRMSHPDAFPNDPKGQAWANERMKEINHAYEVLKDPSKRADYDCQVRADKGEPHRRSAQQERQRQEPRVRCPLCEGRGRIPCLTCQGRGDWSCPGCEGQHVVTCPVCRGQGSMTQSEYERIREEVERAERQARAKQQAEEAARRQRAEEESRRQAAEEERRRAAAARDAQIQQGRRIAGIGGGLLLLLLLVRGCGSGGAPQAQTPPSPPIVAATEAPSAPPSSVEDAVSQVLNDWIETLLHKDFDAHMLHYADRLERYFLKTDVSWSFVKADKQRILERYPNPVSYGISNLQVTPLTADVAIAIFDKAWDFRTAEGERFAGEVRQRLKLRQSWDGRWRIVSEEELSVAWVVRPPKYQPKPVTHRSSVRTSTAPASSRQPRAIQSDVPTKRPVPRPTRSRSAPVPLIPAPADDPVPLIPTPAP